MEVRTVAYAGGRPALCMGWRSLESAATFDRTVESYRLAASDVEGVLFPVGEAFRVARSRDESALLQGAAAEANAQFPNP